MTPTVLAPVTHARLLVDIERLVHHSTIFGLNVESYRRRNASDNKPARWHQLPETEPKGATTTTT